KKKHIPFYLFLFLIAFFPLISKTSGATQSTMPTQFSITVCPHGFGNCGDNVTPQGGGNTNPVHQQKNATLSIYDSTNQLTATAQGTINYSTSAQNFTGTITGNAASGSYIIKLKVDGFLQSQLPGI